MASAGAEASSAEKPVVIMDTPFHAELQPLLEDACKALGALLIVDWGIVERVVAGEGTADDAALAPRVRALLTHSHPAVDAAVLKAFPGVLCVPNFGVGVDHVNVGDATAARVPVGNTPGCLDACVADLTWALILGVARRVGEGERVARDPSTAHFDINWFGSDVSGGTLGIVGLGSIGRIIARRSVGFDMKVLYHNRSRVAPEVEAAAGGAEYVATLEELLSRSDFVVLAVPVTPATTGLIGAPQLSAMKRTAFLINVGRGKLVDQEALCDALEAGTIRGAGLDVTDPEPLPRDHRLLRAPNLLLTPHVGSATLQTRGKMARKCVDCLEAGLRGERLPFCVNPAVYEEAAADGGGAARK